MRVVIEFFFTLLPSADDPLGVAVFKVSYLGFLVVLVALPLLARWRWGLAASLTVTVAEIGLVLLFYFLQYESLHPPSQPPRRGPPDYTAGAIAGLILILVVILPSIAALVGGVLSLLWSAVRAIRRSLASRGTQLQ